MFIPELGTPPPPPLVPPAATWEYGVVIVPVVAVATVKGTDQLQS